MAPAGNTFFLENLRSNANIALRVAVAGTPTELITLEGNSGDVGINRTSPEQDLDIDGIVRIRQWAAASGIGYPVYANSNNDLYKGLSSRRYKTAIAPLQLDTDAALSLQPVTFRWKESGDTDIGLIAEDTAAHLPEIVVYDQQGRPDSVRYDKLAVCLLDLVKKQQQQIDELQQALDSYEHLHQQITELQAQIRNLNDSRGLAK
jgi:hypothetical protein